jgi:hypothetical protein
MSSGLQAPLQSLHSYNDVLWFGRGSHALGALVLGWNTDQTVQVFSVGSVPHAAGKKWGN